MRKKGAIAAIAVILISWGAIALTITSFPPSVDSQLHSAIGRAMAEQTRAVFPAGGSIIVICRDTTEFAQPAADIQFRAFEREIRRAGLPEPTIRKLELDPARPLEVAPGDFLDLIRKAPPNAVIVSLMGPPILTLEQKKQLGKAHAKIVAFCSGSLPARVNLSTLFHEGLLDAGVASNYPSPPGSGKSGKLGFDQLYSVLKPTDLPRPFQPASDPRR
ncbi:MAG TPA: hypothetical protein VGR78_08455 [Verrucomicrobiae bacterium]|nr:hypothetical protein [Verrucomicrobiae bacterium]